MTQKIGLRASGVFSSRKKSAFHSGIKCFPYSAMFDCEARGGLNTSTLPVEVIARKETEEDLPAVTPIRSHYDNDSSLSQTNRVANQIQATSDETRAHDVTDRVLLPVEHGYTSAQDTGDNLTSQQMTAEILDIPTRPSSLTATLSAYDVESPVSSGEPEEHKTSLSSSPSDAPVTSTEKQRSITRQRNEKVSS
ncbi:integrase core domain protein [Plakobranchus ocellatus]|uniref:Integrase core domain protein n=1 Tax=Plakobranchus ocellatus TaxID=259542 RepID=A0AAV4AIY8_9GAST|nr:integrase core domain protein [Plakobranchus ocellatus]